METTTSGRVLPIRGGDMLAPAFCGICRKPGSDVDEEFADPSELFADPQIMEEFFGSLYFCRACSLSLAAIFGAQSNEEVAELKREHQSLKETVITQAEIIEELGEALDALRRVDERIGNVTALANSLASESVTQAEPDSQQGLSEPTEQRTDEGAVVTESSNGEGPDDPNEPASDDVDSWLRQL